MDHHVSLWGLPLPIHRLRGLNNRTVPPLCAGGQRSDISADRVGSSWGREGESPPGLLPAWGCYLLSLPSRPLSFVGVFPFHKDTVTRVVLLVASSCPTLWDPMDRSPPGSSVSGILQARILEWVAIPFSRGSSQPRGWIHISCTVGGFFTVWATREAPIWCLDCPHPRQWSHFNLIPSVKSLSPNKVLSK